MPSAAPVTARATIRVDRLTKRFGKLTAVSELSFAVAPGEVVGFLGPNGAGKTTTIRSLMGFIAPTSGDCRVLGGSLGRDVPLRRRVGYLPGDFRVDPAFTARDLFAWFGRLRGDRSAARAAELAGRLELETHRRFGELSKGNRQKVGLVQAFMSDPDVLILDEPTSGLDPLVQHVFLELVAEAAGRGAAVLFSSHVLPEVERAAARVVIIRQGRLVAAGPVAQLLASARHRLEIHFAQAVPPALFDGVPGLADVKSHGDTAVIAVDGPVGGALRAALGGPAVLTVRPAGDDLEDLFLSIYGADEER